MLPKDKDQRILELEEDVQTLTQTIQELNHIIDCLHDDYEKTAKCLESIEELSKKALSILHQ